MHFFKRLIGELIAEGHSVDVAANDKIKEFPDYYYSDFGGRVYTIPCSRSPFSADSYRAIKEIKKLVSENGYDIVHCNTPIAGACARIACKGFRKHGLRVIYTAHGFHFYEGAPVKNWLIYYPIEKLCSRYTDTLITINQEDYRFARKKLKAKSVEHIPSAGLDVERFRGAHNDREALRDEFSIPQDAFLLISVGELIENKNHQIVIRALSKLNEHDIYYILVGKGHLRDELARLAESLGVSDRVRFAGFRTDVPRLYKMADAEVFPSIREGFGLVGVEGMAAGLPLICSDNRGTREYMPAYAETGYTGMCRSEDDFAEAIRLLYSDPELRRRLTEIGDTVCENYSDRIVCDKMKQIYGAI